MKIKNTITIFWAYFLFTALGGSALGFISLGLPGLLIGLTGGLLMGLAIRKGISLLKTGSR